MKPQDVIYMIAGITAGISIIISGFTIYKHLVNWNEPHLQKLIVRILFMIPIYAIASFCSLVFTNAAKYVDLFRDCYEAYVIYIFFALLLGFLGGEELLRRQLEEKPKFRHPPPMCCFSSKPGGIFLHQCKQMILQFVIAKPVLAILAFILGMFGKYREGDFKWNSAYLYITLLDNVSITLSMYFLVLFYLATSEELRPYKPIPKFLCIKAIVFFIFWQGVIVAFIGYMDWINDTKSLSKSNIEQAIQDFLVCLELLPLSLAFLYAFGPNYKEGGSQVLAELRDMGNLKKHVRVMSQNIKPVIQRLGETVNQRDVLEETYTAYTTSAKTRKYIAIEDFMDVSHIEQQRRVALHGWLEKKGDTNMSLWKRRFFLLITKPPGLVYFENDVYQSSDLNRGEEPLLSQPLAQPLRYSYNSTADSEERPSATQKRSPLKNFRPLGFIDFKMVSELETEGPTGRYFSLITPQRRWVLRFAFESQADSDSWFSKMRQVLAQAHELRRQEAEKSLELQKKKLQQEAAIMEVGEEELEESFDGERAAEEDGSHFQHQLEEATSDEIHLVVPEDNNV